MKPVAFDYHAPSTVLDALNLITGTGTGNTSTVVLAGGQSLVPLLNTRTVRPATVVDLNRLPGLDGITITADTVTVGAMRRLHDIENDPALRAALPILPETAALVARPQIRRRSTIGGSLCHADPAAELPTLAIALDARLHLRSLRGDRVEPAASFFRAAHSTARRGDELLVAVELPVYPGMRFAFAEIPRHGQGGRPLAGLCLGVTLDDGVVTAARLAAGGIASRPVRLTEAEATLVGLRPQDDLAAVFDAATPLVDVPGPAAEAGYRRSLLCALIRRTIGRLTSGQGAEDEHP
jgi:carbon-monoxide dehydrogenase medium subunit